MPGGAPRAAVRRGCARPRRPRARRRSRALRSLLGWAVGVSIALAVAADAAIGLLRVR